MIALLATIFVTSLAGSLHCLAMCGPLVGLVGEHSLRLAGVHALGRLLTYVTLGAAAGLVGGAVNLAGRLGQVQHAATLIAGAIVVILGRAHDRDRALVVDSASRRRRGIRAWPGPTPWTPPGRARVDRGRAHRPRPVRLAMGVRRLRGGNR